nr:hypothetical protein [Clostridia bacterium]
MKKLITSLLLIAMLTTSLISCGGGDTGTPADTTSAQVDIAETTESAAETTTERLKADVPEKKYDGYEFRIMARNVEHQKWEAIDIVAEEENGDPINDAVYNRNRELEEKFDIKVVRKDVKGPASVIKPLVLAGEDAADLVTDSVNALTTLMSDKLIVDYNDIPYINYEAPWWDTNLIEGLSAKNQVYMMTGDISITDNFGTWILGFNKDMIKEFSKKDPYELIENGTWTYDEMLTMMEGVAGDLDGNGVMEDFDRYALTGEAYNTYVFLAGSGAHITAKDENDLPYLDLFNERTAQALEKVLDIQNDKSKVLLSDWLKGTYTSKFDDCINKNFGEGRVLLWMGSMKVIEILRGYDVNFGLAPTPKYDEAQDRYYTSFSNSNCTAYSVPVTNKDLERTGILTEAMAAESMYTLTPAYYEVTLKGKALRDDESEAILDLVFDSRLFDLGMVYKWGNLFNIFSTMTKENSRDFSSKYAALESTTQAAIDKFVNSLD